jgi:transposase
MTTALLTMSERECERAELMRRVHERRLTQRRAAQMLGMSLRQVERLYRAYKHSGPKSLVSRKRGRPSNRRLSEELRRTAVGLIRARYSDFGPTLANEKLREEHQLRVSTETLRRWMIEDGLWLPHARRRDRIHQPRRRRDCLGELVQIDGCDHEWFEERGPRCVLLVYVDDATSKLMELRFCEAESTFEYFASTRRYLEHHGKPVAFYSDKAAVFRVNSRDPAGGDGITQFGRAMSELNIDTICANSAPAKGRVERAHLTLQDRLVKELRLRGICCSAEANVYAQEFRDLYNERFGKAASNDFDAHRPLLESESLDEVFVWKELRKVSKNLTVHFQRKLYLLENTEHAQGLAGKTATVCESDDGTVTIRDGKHILPARPFEKDDARISQGAIVSNKLLAGALQHIKKQQAQKDQARLQNLRTRRERRLLKKRATEVA